MSTKSSCDVRGDGNASLAALLAVAVILPESSATQRTSGRISTMMPSPPFPINVLHKGHSMLPLMGYDWGFSGEKVHLVQNVSAYYSKADYWVQYVSAYDTKADYWVQYGSTYDTKADYWVQYGSKYDSKADYWVQYGSTYDTKADYWVRYGSTYDSKADYWVQYGSTYDSKAIFHLSCLNCAGEILPSNSQTVIHHLSEIS